jgi:hypothetical protein
MICPHHSVVYYDLSTSFQIAVLWVVNPLLNIPKFIGTSGFVFKIDPEDEDSTLKTRADQVPALLLTRGTYICFLRITEYVCRMLLPSWLYGILNFSHDRSKLYISSFSSTSSQNCPGICDLLAEVFNFQHHKKHCSKCSILLVSYLNLITICWWRRPSSSGMPRLSWQFWI